MKKVMKHLGHNTTVDALILHKLMDGKIHKRQELADKAEVSTRTVQRSIERLRRYFIIHTFVGHSEISGIRLDEQHLYFGLKRN